MTKLLTHSHTRRHLMRLAAAGIAGLPMIVMAEKSAMADHEHEHEHEGREGDGNCLLKGTRILTASGERPIEELRIGDLVETLRGRKAVKWIGYSRFRKSEGRTWPEVVLPVRVMRFAIDDRTPCRDLYLSGEHCLFLDGVLVPVRLLINNTSIACHLPADVQALEYYHIELDTHEVLLAEGSAVESFYVGTDTGRDNFSNFIEYERLYGADHRPVMTPFAPILGYHGGRDELKGLIRSVASKFVDVRDPVQVVYDRLAARARELVD